MKAVVRGRSTYGRHTLGDAIPESDRRGDGTGVGWGRQDKINAGEGDRGRDRITKRKLAKANSGTKNNESMDAALAIMPDTRNARNVWTIAPKAFREAHFATFPPDLARRCIAAGTPPTVCGYCGVVDGCGGICATFERQPGLVLDPFGGAGTVGLVARDLGLRSILIELNPEYAEIAHRRIFGPAIGPILGRIFPVAVEQIREAA